MEGVPVEFKVATIFVAITALLPMPLITRRTLTACYGLNRFFKIIIDECGETLNGLGFHLYCAEGCLFNGRLHSFDVR